MGMEEADSQARTLHPENGSLCPLAIRGLPQTHPSSAWEKPQDPAVQ